MPDPNDHPHGHVIKTYVVGPYTIHEYHPHKIEGSNYLREIDKEATMFYGYVEGGKQREIWETLDDALVGLVVKRNAGLNNSAIARHFIAGLRGLSG